MKCTNTKVILIKPKVNVTNTKTKKIPLKNYNKGKYNKNQNEIDKTRLKFYKTLNEI